MVQGRGHLPTAREVVLRFQRRRRRRPARTDLQTGLHRQPGRGHDLAAAVLSVAPARRRLRHRRLPRRASRLRHRGRRAQADPRRPCARPARDHRAGGEPYLRPASVVPAGARRAPRLGRAQLLRLVGQRQGLRRHPRHLLRHRKIELDLGPGRQCLLLAPLLLAPARPELRQPASAQGSAGGDAALARHGRGRPAAGRRALPGRARGHQQREPARDPSGAQAHPRRHRRRIPGPPAAGRGQPVARGRAGVFRQRRRMPHVVPLPADAAHVHGHRAGRPLSHHRHHPPDAGHPRHLPVGHLPAQPRRTDAGDGHQPRTRLPVERLCGRSARAHQPGHPPPAGAAAGTRPAPRRIDEQPAAVHAGHAGALLRRRTGHGRQRAPGRPRRRVPADAVVARPQRRLLARRPRARC